MWPDLRADLMIDGVMTNITHHLRTKGGALVNSRGRRASGDRTDAGDCRPVLNNKDGLYSPENPRSPLFGKIGRNTPFRLSVNVGTPALELPGNIGDHASTPDDATLDITGDLDVRVDSTLANWLRPAVGTNGIAELMAKMSFAAGTKSWLIGTRNNSLYFRWSQDGTNNLDATSTVPLPVPASGRIALRVILDVDNGAGGRTLKFYTATSLAGPWTQLGASIVQAGTTSIFNSTTALKIGDASDIGLTRPFGRVHKAEIRNGIDGAIVASPDFTAQTIGAPSFVDSSGRTWTMNGGTRISNRRTRAAYEMSALPTRWHVSGKDVWVPAESAGILRRLRQGKKPLQSTLRRRVPSYSPTAYWPFEEGRGATQPSSPIAGVRSMTVSGVEFASDDSLGGSGPLPAWSEDAEGRGLIPTAPTGAWHLECVMRLDTMPTSLNSLFEINTTGTAKKYTVRIQTNNVQVRALDEDGAELALINITAPEFTGRWNRFILWGQQQGGNVQMHVAWIGVGITGVASDTTFAGTEGRVSSVRVFGVPGNLRLGHLAVFPTTNTLAFDRADDGFAGEATSQRLERLRTELNLPILLSGTPEAQPLMGAQRPQTPLTLLEQCEDADGGFLYEDRDALALRYRDRVSMENQAPALVLDYEAPGLADPLEPVPDDRLARNDITVRRTNGGEGYAVLEEGALSVQDPPAGIGPYDEAYDLNLFSDDQTEPIAYWRLHLGTAPGPRYTSVRVMVHRAKSQVDQILAVDVGDKIVIRNPPVWLPPGDIELIVQGYEETFTEGTWDIVFNCAPGAPWNVGVVEDPVFGRVDTDGSELAAAVDADDTTLSVFTELGPWTTAYPSLTANPAFEEDLTGWSSLGGVQVRVPAPLPVPFDGDWSLFFVPDGVSQFPNSGTDQVPVVPGRQYVASGWLRCSVTRSVALNVNWFASGGAYQATDANDVPVITGVWQWFEKTITAPVGAVTANLAATVADFPPTTDVLWVHQATLRPAGGLPQDFPFPIKASGEEMKVWAITSGVVDTFTRTTTPGWGTPDIGSAWVSSGGAGGDHFTQGSEAAHQLTNVDVARLDLTPVAGPDHDVQADIATGALAAGGPQLVSVVARATDDASLYMAQLSFSTTQVITLTLRKRLAGVETQLATYTVPAPLTHSAFAFYRVRFQVIGNQLRARVWSASAPDPRGWQVTATDASLTAGGNIGLRSVRQTANSNANLIASFDNVQLLNPQKFTVERSVNEVAKSHGAGTDVRLAYPTIVAL
ncbi:hypothetical protein [Streptomyces sp. NBC_00258]|uniref:hypothetical protein n=1 Tax=Streptomyces sp. NBC_00258 TaxID=2903642 RepID=UPI002E2B2522|nr:hypothetical protein [Streptomyces sp. NBC_00258]